jgi:hypothetical protein
MYLASTSLRLPVAVSLARASPIFFKSGSAVNSGARTSYIKISILGLELYQAECKSVRFRALFG